MDTPWEAMLSAPNMYINARTRGNVIVVSAPGLFPHHRGLRRGGGGGVVSEQANYHVPRALNTGADRSGPPPLPTAIIRRKKYEHLGP